MTNQKIDTKELIINETIKLIKDKKDADKISMRSIAKNADIAVSVINYHFQTKANLIDKAVQTYVRNVIKNSNQRHSSMDLKPEQRIRSGINSAANFLAENPGISRVSILNGLKDGRIGDNSDQMYRSILSQLKNYFNDQYDEITIKILAQQQLSALQQIFLRYEVFKEQTELDFFNEKDRKKITETIVDTFIGKLK